MATITQWKILRTLSTKKKGTQEIREALLDEGVDITLRSVQRNLETLSDLFPITSDFGNPAGWRWMEGAKLETFPVMDPGTALTFSLAEQHLKDMLPRSCMASLTPYMNNARELLNEGSDLKVAQWPKRVARLTRTQHLLTPEVSAEVLDAVYQAILNDVQLEVQYRSSTTKKARDYLLHPLGLVFADGVIYLVATAWDYEDVRQFALHRMSQASVLEEPAKVHNDFDLDGYVAEGNFEFPLNGDPINLKLSVDDWLASYLSESRLAEDQKI